ncbi:hypothetical protein ASPVEDRAFT_52754 [Aspergillus versicolor CBS 583.65]|uniref:FAD/NAD(P)-binding domain-containing protein n=1 Tax=Aspergillus versicolor CBS 583.65 TaxID=1036611 RepID=A0A1L9PK85_ASPVE|nr:uncharacterized protein ASPVEDRAFT_52754 [Aspergillus versicolor CBS 583.65]OJJ01939.1 hypothetical protein ASPVEDRAFT_52754 [Aspergillus versicolor CBS 583.65]
MEQKSYDAFVVGAGFGGIYQLYSLLQLGLTVKLIDKAGGPGGTWYWNRYPGAMSDSPSHLYRYSWDKEDLMSYPWSNNYLEAKEVLAYLEHVVDRHSLRKHMQFNTELLSAQWNEDEHTWTIETSDGLFTARYLVTALGILSDPNWPDVPGRDNFQGELYHTARWPEHYDFKNKRVAVIGNGSTGIQVITRLAPLVGSLLCFQRHPQYTIPAGRRAVSQSEREEINQNYDKLLEQARQSIGGMGVLESKTPAMSVSAEEREGVFQTAWDEGNAFRFFLGTFADLVMDEDANRSACDFIKRKISEIVQDPGKRRKLTPTELYVRRPVCDVGYYEQFNRDNVDIVDIAQSPMVEFTTNGIKLADGTIHELDVVICATGYDAFDGPYKRSNITGRNGLNLKEHWKNGPSTNMGIAVAGFPNMFLLYGPQSPLANVPTVMEAQVEFVAGAISLAEAHQKEQNSMCKSAQIAIESTQQGEEEWAGLTKAISDATLFRTAQSYFFGKNVKDKADFAYVFLGGVSLYLQKVKECQDGGYQSFCAF